MDERNRQNLSNEERYKLLNQMADKDEALNPVDANEPSAKRRRSPNPTPEVKTEILRRLVKGASKEAIAQEYGVPVSVLSDIMGQYAKLKAETIGKINKKRKRVVLTLHQKLEILEKLDHGRKRAGLAEEYGVSVSAITDIKGQRWQLTRYARENDNIPSAMNRKTMKPTEESEVDRALFLWYKQEKRRRTSTITAERMKQKGKFFASEFGIRDFIATESWLKRFKDRHGIRAFSSERSLKALSFQEEIINFVNEEVGGLPESSVEEDGSSGTGEFICCPQRSCSLQMSTHKGMDRWVDRVALVTGASAGCGAALCQSLVKHGMKVIGCARRVERIQAIEKDLCEPSGQLIPYQCDLGKEDEVTNMFDHIKQEYGGVDVCINNAACGSPHSLLEGSVGLWRDMMNVNVISVTQCTQLSIKSMTDRNIQDGCIININSLAGHLVPHSNPAHFYSATKYALRALTEGFRQELREMKSPIRIAEISPALISTEIYKATFNVTEAEAKQFYDSQPHLKPSDIVDTIEHLLSLPPHVEVHDMILRHKDTYA